jgi:maltose alpha-D-glucosyltransferase/alpha-amylase
MKRDEPGQSPVQAPVGTAPANTAKARPQRRGKPAALSDDPLWYKDAIIYQVHIKSFFDANNDGVGDFPGLIAKLDYIAELGVNAIWLLPFYPSPRRDDGYDIADYRNVHPDYGQLSDVKRFIQEAHARGIRVGSTPVVPARAPRQAGFQSPQLLRVVRYRSEVPGNADHLHRLRAVELDARPGGGRVLLAPLLFAPARSKFR